MLKEISRRIDEGRNGFTKAKLTFKKVQIQDDLVRNHIHSSSFKLKYNCRSAFLLIYFHVNSSSQDLNFKNVMFMIWA